MSKDTIQVITTALTRVTRLVSAFELYDRTCNLNTIGQSDQNFTDMVHQESALTQRSIQAALDYVDGEVLTSLDTALDEVCKTRREYDRITEGSAARAFEHARKAHTLVTEALRKVVSETRVA